MCGELPRVAHERLVYFTPAQIDAAPQKCVEAILAAAVHLGGPVDTQNVECGVTDNAPRSTNSKPA